MLYIQHGLDDMIPSFDRLKKEGSVIIEAECADCIPGQRQR